jgi:hypothetical protein
MGIPAKFALQSPRSSQASVGGDNSTYESLWMEKNYQPTYWNYKRTSYSKITKNSWEIAVGYTFSNGHPLSANPSQTKFEMYPEYYRLTVKTGYAFVIDQQNSILTTNWHTDQKFNNNKFFHEYATGNMVLKDGNLTLEGVNKDITIKNGNLTLEGANKSLNVIGDNSGINVSKGHITSLSGNMVLKDGNLTLEGVNKDITIKNGNLTLEGANKSLNVIGNGSITNTNQLSTQSLTTIRTVHRGTVTDIKIPLSTTTINCSLGNYFEYNGITNFTFSNVPSTPNTVYKCTLKCNGNVRTNNFPSNVKWSRRSFYYEYPSGFNYIVSFTDINGDGSSDVYIITFTTWDNGVTWYADAEKYES